MKKFGFSQLVTLATPWHDNDHGAETSSPTAPGVYILPLILIVQLDLKLNPKTDLNHHPTPLHHKLTKDNVFPS